MSTLPDLQDDYTPYSFDNFTLNFLSVSECSNDKLRNVSVTIRKNEAVLTVVGDEHWIWYIVFPKPLSENTDFSKPLTGAVIPVHAKVIMFEYLVHK